MKINDIVTLWKAGYKAADIKAIPTEQVINHVELVKAGVDKDSIPDMLEMIKEQPYDETAPESDEGHEQEPDDPQPDYKAMYEEEKRKNQRRAANEDISGNEDTKTAFDILKSFLEE